MARLKASCEHCGDQELAPSEVTLILDESGVLDAVYQFMCKGIYHPRHDDEGFARSPLVRRPASEGIVHSLGKVGSHIAVVNMSGIEPTVNTRSMASIQDEDVAHLEHMSIDEFNVSVKSEGM